VKWYYSGVS